MADADLWLLNSCTVKTPSEDTFNNQIRAARAAGKHVVVAGCVPQGQPRGKLVGDLSVVGTQQIDRVVEVVEETLQGRTVRLIGQRRNVDGKGRSPGPRLSLPKIRKNPLIEIIPINSGCLNQCTYCKTKHARGDLSSYHPDELVERARSVFEGGRRALPLPHRITPHRTPPHPATTQIALQAFWVKFRGRRTKTRQPRALNLFMFIVLRDSRQHPTCFPPLPSAPMQTPVRALEDY